MTVAGIALLACQTSGPDPRGREAALAGASARTILVLPLNIVMALPPELEPVVDGVEDAIESYLRSHGKEVTTISLSEARRHWKLSAREAIARRGAGFDDAAPLLVARLRETRDYDALVVPSLVVRPARIQGRTVRWDGTKASFRMKNQPKTQGSVILDTSLKGTIQAASLHLLIYDASGKELQERLIGLSPIQRAEWTGDRDDWLSERQVGIVYSVDRVLEPDGLRDGIARAFEPFLAPIPSEAE